MVDNAGYKRAMRMIWVDKCTVKVKRDTTTSVGRTVQSEETIVSDAPCRLSFDTVTVPEETSSAAKKVQATTLFLSNEYEIPAGSHIIVTHENVTRDYVSSGVPSVYTYHQQIPLTLKGEWA